LGILVKRVVFLGAGKLSAVLLPTVGLLFCLFVSWALIRLETAKVHSTSLKRS
jgi:hypothetical protein